MHTLYNACAFLLLDAQACGNFYVYNDVNSLRVLEFQSGEELFNLLLILPYQTL